MNRTIYVQNFKNHNLKYNIVKLQELCSVSALVNWLQLKK